MSQNRKREPFMMKEESSITIKLLGTSKKEDRSRVVPLMAEKNNKGESKEETLVESIYEELNGRVDREQVRRLLLEANTKYQESTVRAYLPILIRRYVLERLR